MFFKFVYEKSLAQASYVIGCQEKGIAAVIDPKRDVDTYIEIAEENNLKITHIFETHIHADFLCGSRELAALTGAELYLSDEGDENWQYEFQHVGLKNGDKVRLGNVVFEALHTPGHTPEHLSYIVTDEAACDEPVMFFSGDFLFVGDVGRPDLLEKLGGERNSTQAGAYQQFESIKKLFQLKDYIQIWPGHGAGSSCGKSLGAVPVTTLGYEKIRNWAFQFGENKKAFVEELLIDQPEAPRYYATMKKLNKEDRKLVTNVPVMKHLSEKDYKKWKSQGAKIIDTRSPDDYALSHIPEAWNISNSDSFTTEMGWYMNYNEPFILIIEKQNLEEATRKLMRIGLDNAIGFVTPKEFLHWEKENLIVAKSIDKKTLKTKLNRPDIQLIDVRSAKEFKEGHIESAENIMHGTVPENTQKISKVKQVIVYCRTGARSSTAYSYLLSEKFNNIYIYRGGWQDWSKDD